VLITVDDISLQPEKVAQSLILFVQGLGKLSSIPIVGGTSRTRTTSSGE
jgi:hypothetical protein